MSKIKIVLYIVAILLGAFLFVFGGYDDSPGAQGLGLLLVGTGIVVLIKNRKKNSV